MAGFSGRDVWMPSCPIPVSFVVTFWNKSNHLLSCGKQPASTTDNRVLAYGQEHSTGDIYAALIICEINTCNVSTYEEFTVTIFNEV